MLDEGEADAAEADSYASVYQGLMHCLVLDADEALDNDFDNDFHDNIGDGAEPQDWLHIWQAQAVPGDAYLLATDGLHGMLSDAQMQAIWQSADSTQDKMQALHSAYRRAGALDDISVILLELPVR